MRVLLVQPPQGVRFGISQVLMVEPLGLEMVGASLQSRGHSVRLIDLRLDRSSRLKELLDSFRPSAVGLSCGFTTDVYTTLITARKIKERRSELFVFAGGHHPSLIPGDLLFSGSSVDAVVIGEGEQSAVEMVDALEQNDDPGRVPGVMNRDNRNGGFKPRPPIENLDDLPLPARTLTKRYRRRYHHGLSALSSAVEMSRGGPFDGSVFGVRRGHDQRTRHRSPRRIVEDLKQVEALGGRQVLITDDVAFLDRDIYEELGQRIRKAGLELAFVCETRADLVVRHEDLFELWRELGAEAVYLGIEKIDDEGLDIPREPNRGSGDAILEAVERLRGAGITPMTSLITDPDWTNDEFDLLEQSLDDLRLPSSAFTILTPLPGTALWETKKMRVTKDDYSFCDGLHLILPARLGPERFYARLARLYTRNKIGTQLTGPALAGLLAMSGRSRGAIVRRVFGAVSRMRDPTAYSNYPGTNRKPDFVPPGFGTAEWIDESRSYLASGGPKLPAPDGTSAQSTACELSRSRHLAGGPRTPNASEPRCPRSSP